MSANERHCLKCYGAISEARSMLDGLCLRCRDDEALVNDHDYVPPMVERFGKSILLSLCGEEIILPRLTATRLHGELVAALWDLPSAPTDNEEERCG